MNIVLFEDNEAFRDKLAAILLKHKDLGELILSTVDFEEVIAVAKILKPAVFFIDILIYNKTTGLELAAKIKELNAKHHIVFITSYPSYIFYQTKFKLLAINIILKNKHYFISEIIETLQNICFCCKEDKVFQFYQRSLGNKSIPLSNILYIEKIKRSHKVKLCHKKGVVTFNMTLKEILKRLPDDNFIQCHKSYIVNTSEISFIDCKAKTIVLSNSYSCPYTNNYKKALEQWIQLL